ncbi:MAG: hypothetical protein VKS61_00835 [Candidatus Sericytochromatia bacterium]|nr:hypothetical protein [Candidatus Sericytochromatia bacterium]
MRMRNWMAASLSLSVGLGALAGCASGPAPTAPGKAPVVEQVQAPAPATGGTINAPIRAQEGMTSQPPASTATSGSGGSSSGGASATAPTTPSAPAAGTPGGTTTEPVSPGTAVIADAVVGGVGGGVVGMGYTGGFDGEGENGLITFQSDRATGGGAGMDIFVFDAVAATVLALPGVNTLADETNPRLSSNGRWLVYQSNESGDNDVLLFSLESQLINTLPTLNTNADEEQPDVSNDGDVIVYVSNRAGADELRVFDLVDGNNFRVPIANRGLYDVNWPTISGNGEVIAYGASDGQSADVFVYSLRDAAQLTPPFLNTPDGEYNPDLNEQGDLIAFVSNRRGSEDIYAVDMRSGFIDNLVLANSPHTEQEPRWLAGADDALVFHTNRTGEFRIMAYNLETAVLNTLPVANEIGSNTQLRDTTPRLSEKHHDDCKNCHDDKKVEPLDAAAE